jgi:RNA polymerase sigma factor (sigma-70 family)
MPRKQLLGVMAQLRDLVGGCAGQEQSDRELIDRFASRNDHGAFAGLVERHGSLVLGVCRRLLRSEADAEDSFQATFLVLARKAATVSWRLSIRDWLYQTAYRTALEARGRIARRHGREQPLTEGGETESPPDLSWQELRSVLDEELSRLPQKLRGPLLLCYLEGKTRDEAALALGCSAGEVKGRLERGRQLLRERLTRRGLSLSTALLATLLAESAAAAAVPAFLLVSTARAATEFALGSIADSTISPQVVTLTEGVMRAMATKKLKVAASLLLATAVLAGIGSFAYQALARPESSNVPRGAAPQGAVPAPGGLVQRVESVAEDDVQPAEVGKEIAEALKWLARHQAADGRWSCAKFAEHGKCNCTGAGRDSDISATSLALLAFLGAGETHKAGGQDKPLAGLYAKQVERGLKRLMVEQAAAGKFGDGAIDQGQAVLALCEAYGLSADPDLKGTAQRGLDFIIQSQQADGGWRPAGGKSSETAVFVWQLMALKSGKQAGLSVPDENLAKTAKFLDAVAARDGAVYGNTNPRDVQPAVCAGGLLCRQLLGWKPRHPSLIKGIEQLQKVPPDADVFQDMHYYFFATLVMHHQGGDGFAAWYGKMKARLASTQDQGDDADHRDQKGSWSPEGDLREHDGGRVMTTALATLILEVYYRHLPLARRELGK